MQTSEQPKLQQQVPNAGITQVSSLQVQLAHQLASRINHELDFTTFALARQQQESILKRGASVGGKGNQVTIACSVSKFELMEAFQGHTDLVEFFVSRIWSEERVQRVKALSLERVGIEKEKAADSENKASLDKLRKRRDELKKVLKEKSANVMRLQAGIKKKRDEELSQQEDVAVRDNTRKVFLQRYLKRQLSAATSQLDLAKQIKPHLRREGSVKVSPFLQTMPLEQKILKTCQDSLYELIEQARQQPRNEKLVVVMGGVQPIRAMLSTHNLESEQKDYLMQKVLDLIMRQCLEEAREIVPAPFTRDSQSDSKSLLDAHDQLSSNSSTAASDQSQLEMKLEDKYREAIYYLFTRSQTLISQTQRIKDECLSKQYFGALTEKQKKEMAIRQERAMGQFLNELKVQLEDDINKTEERLQYFKSIVNVELSAEYLEEKEQLLAYRTKYLQAYATLVQRIKQRTDDFVKSNAEQMLDQARIVKVFQQKAKDQIDWLAMQTETRSPVVANQSRLQQSKQRLQFLQTLGRAHFLQRNLIEGTQHGTSYMHRTFSADKLGEILESYVARMSAVSEPDSKGPSKMYANQGKKDLQAHGREIRALNTTQVFSSMEGFQEYLQRQMLAKFAVGKRPKQHPAFAQQQRALLGQLLQYNQGAHIDRTKSQKKLEQRTMMHLESACELAEQGVSAYRLENSSWQTDQLIGCKDQSGKTIADYHKLIFNH